MLNYGLKQLDSILRWSDCIEKVYDVNPRGYLSHKI